MTEQLKADMIDSRLAVQARDHLLTLDESERGDMLCRLCEYDAQEFMKERKTDAEIRGVFVNRYRQCRLEPPGELLTRLIGQQRGILNARRSGERDMALFGQTASPTYHLNRRIKAVQSWSENYSFGLGIEALDAITGGCLPAELFVISGAQGSMKTSLLLGAIERAIVNGLKVLFFSLDMSCGEVMERRLQRRLNCSQFQVEDMIRRRDPRIAQLQRQIEQEDAEYFFLYGNDSGKMWDIDSLLKSALAIMPDVLAIDFLTLLRKPGQDDLQCADECMRLLKQFAQQYSVRVVILSQMSRASKREQFAGVVGGHSKGGGIVEELCHSEVELFGDNPVNQGDLPRIIATVTKARRGRAGVSYELEYRPNCIAFTGNAYRVEREKKATKPVFSITHSF